MPTTTTDAQLVAAHLAGDRAAFAAMYDRYGATLYDTAAAMTRNRDDAADIAQDVFVVAAERMEQLRDPDRLKPWLFAILRNEVYRRTGKRKRVVLTDFTEPVAEMTLPSQPADEAADLEYQELAELVRGAAFGLDERDQLVLEYSVRQELQGDDLAAALGVTAQQSYSMVHRMRQRTERSLGAYCVARKGARDCDELAKILDGWDGEFSVLIRKRVARHIDGCDTCERSRRKFAPLALFGAAPAFAAPAELRDRVLGATGGVKPAYAFDAPGGFPAAIKYGRRLGLWVVLATLAMLFVGATTVYVLAAGDDQLAIVDSSSNTTAATDATDAAGGSATTVGTGSTATSDAASTSSTTTTTDTTTTGTSATTVAPIVVTLPSTTSTSTTSTSIVAVLAVTTTTTPSVTTTTAPPPATTTTAPPPTTTTTTPTTTTTTVPPGALSLSAGSIDFGTTTDQAPVTLTNTGGQPVDWSSTTGPAAFRGGVSAFSATPATGTLAAGQSVVVTVTVDRTWPVEGPLATTRLTFVATGTSAAVDLAGEIARPPSIRASSPPAMICSFNPAGAPNPLVATAVVSDESPPLSVRFEAVSPTGDTVATAMFPRRVDWSGSVATDADGDGQPDAGLWTWTITAVDAFGNSAAVSGTTDVVPTFC